MNDKLVLIANLGRLEKLLLFNLISHSEIVIAGIVTDLLPTRIVEFLERDSNHGKFMINKIFTQTSGKSSAKIIFELVNKKITVPIYQEKELKLLKVKNKKFDFVVDLSSNLKTTKLSFYNKIGEKTLVLEDFSLISRKNGAKVAYHFNHNKIKDEYLDLPTIYLPPIEAAIIAIVVRSLKDKFKITNVNFDIVVGPNLSMKTLDSLTNNSQPIYNRSIFNNIIPDAFKHIKQSVLDLLDQEKIHLGIEGSGCYVPATTGGLLKLLFKVEKSFSNKEINERLSQEADDQIGYSKKYLVSQDIVSTHYYAVIDQNLINVDDNKNFVSIGFWYDYESSFAVSVFKLLQYLSGLAKD